MSFEVPLFRSFFKIFASFCIEYSQIGLRLPVFWSFYTIFASFCIGRIIHASFYIGKIIHPQHKGQWVELPKHCIVMHVQWFVKDTGN